MATDSFASSRGVLIAYREQLRQEIREIEKELEMDREPSGAPAVSQTRHTKTSRLAGRTKQPAVVRAELE